LHGYSCQWRLDEEEFSLAPDDVTISPAGLPSAYDLVASGRHWCIHFDPVPESVELVSIPHHLPAGKSAGMLRERFAHIAALQARASYDPIARVSASLACQQLLLSLIDQPASEEQSAVARASALIDERFHEPLAIPQIARLVGQSQAYLSRTFKARYGVTLAHRLVERRVAHARYLLESTDLPIWRVAERVGIPDAQHFNKSVRRILGVSPSAIRAGAGGEPLDPDR
jgi:AraC-like DNA-binding protein